MVTACCRRQKRSRLGRSAYSEEKLFSAFSSIDFVWRSHSSGERPSRLVAQRTPFTISSYGIFSAIRLRNQSCHICLRLGFRGLGGSRESVLLPVRSQNLVAHNAA